jgi:tripartite ATP-independent transporter DctP family solute receptor
LTGCGQGGARVLRGADTHPEGYPTVEGVKAMARLLDERSGGRLRTKLFPGSVLGEERDTLEITIFGGLDFNRVNIGPLNSIAKETLVPTLPFMFRSIAHMRNAMDGAPGEEILSALQPHGLIGLCFYDSGARSFYTTGRLIERPEDLQGLKIRVQSSDLYVSMVEALGGDATPMAYGEVYQGLLQGVIDGAENNWPSYESTRHFEAAKYYSLTRHVMAPEVLLMSAKRWAKLAPDDQALVRQCARDSVPIMRDVWDARVARSREIVMETGVQLIEPDITPFRERVRPVWERYLDTPELRSLASRMEAVEG